MHLEELPSGSWRVTVQHAGAKETLADLLGLDEWHHINARITVDHMIEWLRADVRNGYRFLDVSAWRSTTDQPAWSCSVHLVRDEQDSVFFQGASMFAALENAVRGVAIAS